MPDGDDVLDYYVLRDVKYLPYAFLHLILITQKKLRYTFEVIQKIAIYLGGDQWFCEGAWPEK